MTFDGPGRGESRDVRGRGDKQVAGYNGGDRGIEAIVVNDGVCPCMACLCETDDPASWYCGMRRDSGGCGCARPCIVARFSSADGCRYRMSVVLIRRDASIGLCASVSDRGLISTDIVLDRDRDA